MGMSDYTSLCDNCDEVALGNFTLHRAVVTIPLPGSYSIEVKKCVAGSLCKDCLGAIDPEEDLK